MAVPQAPAALDFRAMTRDERQAWVDDERRQARDEQRPMRMPPRTHRRRWLVAPIVAPLIERLSRGAIGWCNATTLAIRVMAWVDTGYLYGERSIARFIAREWDHGRGRDRGRGRFLHKRIPPGSYFVRTKMHTSNGTCLNRYESEAERREGLWQAKKDRQKQRREQRLARAGRTREDSRPAKSETRPISIELEPVPALDAVETRAALATVLAALQAPPPAAAAVATEARERPSWAELVEEAKARARAFALALEQELEPPPDE